MNGWRQRAACKDHGALMFDGPTEDARAVCEACPVRRECLAYALDIEVTDGVWAATLWGDRVRLCPVCTARKPAGALGCCDAHSEARLARLAELSRMDATPGHDPYFRVTSKQRPSARTNPYCPVPIGQDHVSAAAYKGPEGRTPDGERARLQGCRCALAAEALWMERHARHRATIASKLDAKSGATILGGGA